MWTRHQVDWKVEAPYGHRKGYKGFDGLVNVFSDLCDLSERVTNALTIPTLRIDILDGDWTTYYEQICDFWSDVLGEDVSLKYRIKDRARLSEEIGEGNLSLWREPSVENLKTLPPISCLEKRLDISYTPDLESLEGLETVKELGELRLFQNSRLQSLKPLENLRVLTRLNLAANDLLMSLDGLQNVTELKGGTEIGTSQLKNLDELAFARDVAFLYLSSNPLLENLEGLRSVTHDRGRLTITDHRVLENLNGLRSLERIDREVILSYNDRIRNVDGMNNVTHMGEDLKIVHNPMLENLDGLTNLKSAGDVYIVENGRLSQQAVDCFLNALKDKGWQGNAVVAANGDDYDPGVQINWC